MATYDTGYEIRCPGYHAPDSARSERHCSWRLHPDNPPHKRYYCMSCEAYYPYLVDVSESPPERHATAGPKGPVHDKDDTDYGDA